jgi:hypothetical protein
MYTHRGDEAAKTFTTFTAFTGLHIVFQRVAKASSERGVNVRPAKAINMGRKGASRGGETRCHWADPLSEPLRAAVAELNRVYLELGLAAGDVEMSAAATLAEARMDAAARESDWPRAIEALAEWRDAWRSAFTRAKTLKQGELW